MKTTGRRIDSVLRLSRVKFRLELKVNFELVKYLKETDSTIKNIFSSVALFLDANTPSLPRDQNNQCKKNNEYLCFF